MVPRTVLITGANRGIGLGLTKTFLEVEGAEIVIAGCRNPEKAEELHKIGNSKLHIVQLDVTDDASIQKAVGEVDKIVGDKGLNILINNAGVHIPYYTLQEKPSREDFTKQLDANITSVVIVTQFFLPLIRKAPSDKKIINISSSSGSITNNRTDTQSFGIQKKLAYRISKTAVNQLTKSLSIDLAEDNILAVAFCPGWVQTDLGGSNGLLTAEQSMAELVPSILKVSKEHNGGFFDKSLVVIPY